MSAEQKVEYMTTEPIPRLVSQMAVPTIISMLVTSFYNMVDTMFVGRINTQSTAAVGIVFSVMAIIQACGFFFGHGSGNYISRKLGEQNFEDAKKMAATGFFSAFIVGLVLGALGLIFLRPLSVFLGSTKTILPYTMSYLRIILIGTPFMMSSLVINNQLRFQGSASFAMVGIVTGAVLNIALDPILIFGCHMGVAGAAGATVIGQIVAACMAVFFNLKVNKELHVSFIGFRPDGKLIGQIYKVGIPSIVMQAIGSVMTYGMNLILEAFGAAQTVFGVYFKLQSFIFMPVFGLNNGMVPIIAYNYGADKRERVVKTMKSSIRYAVGIMLMGLLVMEVIPARLIGLFNATPELLEIGVPALRIICLSFCFAGYCIVVGSVFQALGNGVYSMIVSIARQLCVLLPVAYLLSLSGNVNLIWWSFPIAELVSVGMSTFFLRRIYKKVICHIGEGKK